MATYRAEGTCTLVTYVEPDGSLTLDSDDVDNFSDDTSLDSERVEQSAHFSFDIEAADDDDAQEKAEEATNDLSFYSNDLEWEIEDVEISGVERTSPEMTPVEAIEVIRDWVGSFARDDAEPRVKEALGVLCDTLEALLAKETPFTPGEAPAKPGEEINPAW